MSAAVTRTKWKWFWAWDAPKEEKWLEQMAREGWRLARGGVAFKFVKAEPGECRYRLDYRTELGADLREYIALCRDAGWEHVCRFSGWHYFRTSNPDAPELHTDPSSLAERYKKLLALLIIVLALNVSVFNTERWPEGDRWGDFLRVANVIRGALVVLLCYAVYRIAHYIKRLKSDSRRPVI
ncbi:MAG TPA: DUF2812 domain-containing protein [Bryobacteraceae bacterium]|mgnify:CR=1 FL=1|nr:DUF2812 domain-containing protein [Bryobacteraceae bacterium]HPT26412.1 DUF2812 domain-containing protein [Bryobacteraceae bacterium]